MSITLVNLILQDMHVHLRLHLLQKSRADCLVMTVGIKYVKTTFCPEVEAHNAEKVSVGWRPHSLQHRPTHSACQEIIKKFTKPNIVYF